MICHYTSMGVEKRFVSNKNLGRLGYEAIVYNYFSLMKGGGGKVN